MPLSPGTKLGPYENHRSGGCGWYGRSLSVPQHARAPHGTGDRKPILVVKPDLAEGSITYSCLSPDGHWLTYSAFESGREVVYVTSFPSGTGRRQVSIDGAFPVWRCDGKEIFYFGYDSQLHIVETIPRGSR